MYMKYWAALLLVAGVGMIVAAVKADQWASFDDGSFIAEILLFGCGLVCTVAAVIWLIVLAFLAI